VWRPRSAVSAPGGRGAPILPAPSATERSSGTAMEPTPEPGRERSRGTGPDTTPDIATPTRARIDSHTDGSSRNDAHPQTGAAVPLAPIKLSPSTTIGRCVPVGGGLCEVLGPGVTGKPCPSGSIPNPEGGVVCVPRVLALAARLADAAGSATGH